MIPNAKADPQFGVFALLENWKGIDFVSAQDSIGWIGYFLLKQKIETLDESKVEFIY